MTDPLAPEGDNRVSAPPPGLGLGVVVVSASLSDQAVPIPGGRALTPAPACPPARHSTPGLCTERAVGPGGLSQTKGPDAGVTVADEEAADPGGLPRAPAPRAGWTLRV